MADDDQFKFPSLDTKIKFVPKKNSKQPDEKASVISDHPSEHIFKAPSLETTNNTDEPSGNKSATLKSGPKIKCPYTEPKWSSKPAPEHSYDIEMLKSGQIVETVSNLEHRSYWVIGKLPDNHIVMAHPTISRYHAVLQYRPEVSQTKTDEDDKNGETDENHKTEITSKIEKGWYLFDLGSTHGSFVNKRKIPPKTYVRVRVGYLMTFGGSTRKLILQGPEFDAEAESELTITEMKEQKRQRQEALVEQAKLEEQRKEAEGISWGMADDADEETDLTINPYASTNNEELYLQDPKKTLRGYFEREGLDLDYKVDELAVASFICRIELPVCDSNGRPLIAEIAHKGKKKDCVLQAAMEACRILDRHGVLRQSHHESRKRKIQHNSDSDGDDEFYDRTGDVARKRSEKEAAEQSHAFSYDELLEQERVLLQKLEDVDRNIAKYQELERKHKEQNAADVDLDDFVTKMTREKFDKTDIRRLRVEAVNIKTDHAKLQRLINIARPNNLPALIAPVSTAACSATESESTTIISEKKKLVLPLFGKRGTFKFSSAKNNVVKNVDKQTHNSEPENDDVEVEENTSGLLSSDEAPDSFKKDQTTNESGTQLDNQKKTPTQNTTTDRCNSDKFKNDDTSTIGQHFEDNEIDYSELVDNEDNKSSTDNTNDQQINYATTAKVSKKRRNRPRQRNDRHCENVDFDESTELISSDKYSTWVPPSDQTGDGSTTLNDKYGY